MENNYINKLITMSDNNQYVILEEIEHDGKKYALANEVVDNDLGTDITLFRVENVNGKINFIVEKNLEVAQEILLKML